MNREKQNFSSKLWLAGILIHSVVFCLILDVYFTSPITTGMTPHKVHKPFAKRAVLFVADGLRSETFFSSTNNRTPFLSNICNGTGSYGVIHTRVPTESRPGHVAILAGLYEDPSAIFTGWKENLVEFDSIVNESNYVWAMGSPDIVKIFPKQESNKLYSASYDPEDEDFSGKSSTINLDNWVFDHMKSLLVHERPCFAKMHLEQKLNAITSERKKYMSIKDKCVSDSKGCEDKVYSVLGNLFITEMELTKKILGLKISCNVNCTKLCEEGNFFFLHLLGMDSAGHIYKPDSKEYYENLIAVDSGIKSTVEAIDFFFGDNETVYIFTADHGMTNWGSHGDGSDHETMVPYVAWGKGIKRDVKRHDMNQADLTPLIASLIGVPIPINSVGVLSYNLLDGRAVDIAQAMLTNVEQISEQYTLLRKSLKRSPLIHEYPAFTDNTVEKQILNLKLLLENGEVMDVLMKCHSLIDDLKHGINYINNYYYYPKLTCIMLGFIIWMACLLISTMDSPKYNYNIRLRISNLFTNIMIVIASIMLIIVSFLIHTHSSYTAYIYALFPVIVIILACCNDDLMEKVISLNSYKKSKRMLFAVVYSCLIQFLVNSFFTKVHCSVIFGALFVWIIFVNINGFVKIMWMTCCAILTGLLFVNTTTKFTYIGFALGASAWIIFYLRVIQCKLHEFMDSMEYRSFSWRCFRSIPFFLFLLAAINSIAVEHSFANENGISMFSKITSWSVTVCAIISIFTSPTTIYGRFGQLSSCLIIPLVLMSVNIELFVYTVIVGLLYLWIHIESTVFQGCINLNFQCYNDLEEIGSSTRVADFRRTFIYISLIIGYYFAIGNIASVNGFDPMWTRAYVSTFNPILMCVLIVIKIVIPFLIITCAFHTINKLTMANSTTTFKILMFYCDQMVVNFIFYIRNEGSWKDIGQSLSHFVIMETLIIFMILFYVLSGYITRLKIPIYNRNAHTKYALFVPLTRGDDEEIEKED